MGPHGPEEPVSLLAGLLWAVVGLAILVPVVVRLLRERRAVKQRDAQWQTASQAERDQLNAIYDLRQDLREALGGLDPGDFSLEMAVAEAYDRFIDASWATRHQGGLESGFVDARTFVDDARGLAGDDRDGLAELEAAIVQRVEAMSQEVEKPAG